MPILGSKMPNMGTRGERSGGLADALFTTTQQRVFALLFGQPDRSFIQQELIERAGVGSGAVRRELARLIKTGLVNATIVGKQKHLQANRAAPIFEELRGLVMKTVALTDPLRAALRPLASHIELALVYGSVARGLDGAKSDIDLLIVSDGVTLEDIFARLTPLERKLGRTISPTLYTRSDFERRRRNGNAFVKNVMAGEKIVLIGNVSDVDEPR